MTLSLHGTTQGRDDYRTAFEVYMTVESHNRPWISWFEVTNVTHKTPHSWYGLKTKVYY